MFQGQIQESETPLLFGKKSGKQKKEIMPSMALPFPPNLLKTGALCCAQLSLFFWKNA